MKKIEITTKPELVAKYLYAGKIIAYPTEGVWGVGCDANNTKSVEKLYSLKQRPKNKPMLCLCSKFMQISSLTSNLSKEKVAHLKKHWPGFVTFIVPLSKEQQFSHITGDKSTLALRMTNHSPLQEVFRFFNGFIVSTSVNVSGKKPLTNIKQIITEFPENLDAIFDAPLGFYKSPSPIFSLTDYARLR